MDKEEYEGWNKYKSGDDADVPLFEFVQSLIIVLVEDDEEDIDSHSQCP